MPKHAGNGPPHGSNAIYNDDGELVILHGQQADGTYGTRYYDPNGTSIVRIGNLGTLGSLTTGIWLRNNQGTTLFRVDDLNGQSAPFVFAAPLPNGSATPSTAGGFRPGTTSATAFELWRADFYAIGDRVQYDLTMYANSGDMNWQIKAYEYGAVGTGTPTVVATGHETTNVQRSGTFTIPSTCLVSTGTDDVAGRYMTLRVEALKNSGSFTVDVAPNAPFFNHA